MPPSLEPDGPTAGNGVNGDEREDNTAEVRRSSRSRKPATRYYIDNDDDEDDEDELALHTPTKPGKGRSIKVVRRNPTRKAATAAEEYHLPDNLLEESIAAIRDEEREDWQGWVELESEPSFFNVILRQLGVRDVKIQELFAVDEGSLGFLPKPVFGLIFLYQVAEEESNGERPRCPDNIWFANQTTDNACATIALMNIVMNGEGLKLGEELKEFKSSTRHLTPPLRGYALSANSFIRTIHNSFARRLDLLNADLALRNAFDESNKKKRTVSRRSRKKPQSEAAFHFIAYVPIADQVWELDGLETQPSCLGPFEGDWTAIARPIIEARMLQYEEDNLSFNLLALCRSPLEAVRQELARNIQRLRVLWDGFWARHREHATNVVLDPDDTLGKKWIHGDDEGELASLGIQKNDILKVQLEESFQTRIRAPDFDLTSALELQQNLEKEQERIVAECFDEIKTIEEDEARFRGRKKDYTPAIHEWIKTLAEHGILQDLVEEYR
ncbi:Ubiquitin carboxyl-terminal hydrolase [Pleurostoma richardsiae]|uniref:Ubiquitin carboxyl-terminal hydrolase n=1 Tax=Pleurostoma richardsiae TaxID=41990 RepID=A0AA38R624_9PEZI|nr:Ubiquitin carboxyl-terminal hydrolase [Pleurostoma richardsiae]